MIDRLVIVFSERRHAAFDPNYEVSDAILSSELQNPDAPDLTVIFPPWHGGNTMPLEILRKRLTRSGSAVLSYNFHDQILSADENKVVDSFAYIQKTAAEEIRQLVDEHQYKRLHLIGLSIGTLSMSMVARELKDVSSATFVLGASRLAPCVWEGTRTQQIQQDMEKSGMTLSHLEESWKDLAPSLSALSFKNKPVQIITSGTDSSIPSRYQYELLNDFKNAGAHVVHQNSNSGHVMNLIKYCILGNL